MRKISFVLFLSIACLSVKAQLINLGLKAGFNIQNVAISDFNGNQIIEEVSNGDSKTGFHAGLYTQINLGVIHIRPEFLYTYVNNSITTKSVSGELKEFDLKFNRFDVPLLVGTKFGPLRLNTGPVMSFIIGEPDDAFKQGINDATWGYQFGGGLDIGKISLDIRYEGSFSNITESITIDGDTFNADARGSQIMIGIGFQLF